MSILSSSGHGKAFYDEERKKWLDSHGLFDRYYIEEDHTITIDENMQRYFFRITDDFFVNGKLPAIIKFNDLKDLSLDLYTSEKIDLNGAPGKANGLSIISSDNKKYGVRSIDNFNVFISAGPTYIKSCSTYNKSNNYDIYNFKNSSITYTSGYETTVSLYLETKVTGDLKIKSNNNSHLWVVLPIMMNTYEKGYFDFYNDVTDYITNDLEWKNMIDSPLGYKVLSEKIFYLNSEQQNMLRGILDKHFSQIDFDTFEQVSIHVQVEDSWNNFNIYVNNKIGKIYIESGE